MVITSSEPCSGILHLETPWLLTLATESLWPSKASNRRPGPRGTQPRSSSHLSSQGSSGSRGQSQTFKTAGTGWPAELFSRHALFVSLPFDPKQSRYKVEIREYISITHGLFPLEWQSVDAPWLSIKKALFNFKIKTFPGSKFLMQNKKCVSHFAALSISLPILAERDIYNQCNHKGGRWGRGAISSSTRPGKTATFAKSRGLSGKFN